MADEMQGGPDLPGVFAEALACHRAGRMDEAERLYRRVLAADPRHAASLHLLGLVAHQSGRHDLAVDLIGQAIAIDATNAAYHTNLGVMLKDLGRPDEAVACCRRAVELQPTLPEAHNNLGLALKSLGRRDDAADCFRAALALRPDYPEACGNLGNALISDPARLTEAESCYRRAIELKPDLPEAHNSLGNALKQQGRWDEAIACWHTALALRPGYPEAVANLGGLITDYERIQPIVTTTVDGVQLRFFAPTTKVLWRIQTIESKEPWTYRWALSMTGDDILVDVGANIGLFTLLASGVRKARSYAFEPDAQNYSLLIRNLVANGVCDRATAYCAAVTDRFRIDRMYLSAVEAGGSCHQFGHNVDMNLQPANFSVTQGCVGLSLDDAVAAGSIEQPTHLKVDVDGYEHLVLAGAPATLSSPRLRSVQLELNLAIPEHKDTLERMGGYGFTYDPDQMMAASHAVFGHPNHYDLIFHRQ